MQKIVVICGPTSSGKTKLAVELATSMGGEIISADSRQVYRDLDIGTNKGDLEFKDNQYLVQNIPIHLVNLIDPDQRYSVYDFKRDSDAKVEELKDKNIFLVGGTGLYIDSIFRNYDLQDNVENTYEDVDLDKLQKTYKEKYPKEYEQLNVSDKSNPRRLSMHLSKLEKGITLVQNQNQKYELIFLYPSFDREDLRNRIHNRVEEMFKEGLVEETLKAKEKYGENSIALHGIGYSEVLDLLSGKITGKQCLELVKNAHWHYAKRQITWFEGEGRGYELNKINSTDMAAKLVNTFLMK